MYRDSIHVICPSFSLQICDVKSIALTFWVGFQELQLNYTKTYRYHGYCELIAVLTNQSNARLTQVGLYIKLYALQFGHS
jgi:hypothetical protein